jgi:metal-responsive CopG/Arc/MetJ family transcriptional regulator
MGRPPLNNKPILVRLSEESIAKIDSLVGTYGRSKFIREAVENEIERRATEVLPESKE